MSDSLSIVTKANGVGNSTLDDIKNSNYDTIEKLSTASPEELADSETGISGVGFTTAINILKVLEEHGYREYDEQEKRLQKLIFLLEDLFEFDKKDRDFGVYKLMNEKRDVVNNFIHNELRNKIKTEVDNLEVESADIDIDAEREEIKETLGEHAIKPDGTIADKYTDSPITQDYQKAIENSNTNNLDNIEVEIYNHIYNFFNRYYDSGDFITQRFRTQNEPPYSVPYDGSDTHFHWVTKNQYYSKTSENFLRFSFNSDEYKLNFITVNSEDIDDGIGDNEYFILPESDYLNIDEDENTIKIEFERRQVTESDLESRGISKGVHNKQEYLNDSMSTELAQQLPDSIESNELNEKLDEYTARNTSDFFIHKNLEEFLTNELQEYIKTEVLHYSLDGGADINQVSNQKAQIIASVSKKIISFISSIEKFKKKVFEKKKFVKESKELIQVKNISEEHYELILQNDGQIKEWEESFNIDSSELNPESLKEKSYNQLLVDTSYFEQNITNREEPQNKLIKGDNYQALNFLQEKYENSVKCIYIDPPYNTGNANFAYKDKYQRPTWLSMMYDRIQVAHNMLSSDGVIFASIGEKEVSNLEKIFNSVFGEENKITKVSRVTEKGNNKGRYFSSSVDYVIVYAKDIESLHNFSAPEPEEYKEKFNKEDEQGRYKLESLYKSNIPSNRTNCIYEIETPDGNIVKPPEGGAFRWSENRFEEELEENNIVIKKSNNSPLVDKNGDKMPWNVYTKNYLKGSKLIPNNYFDEFTNRKSKLSELGLEYTHPKPEKLVRYLLELLELKNGDVVLDFFAGSGTTAQAVQELNRERDEKVNYVLVEMLEEAFDITEERIKRTAYTKEWNDGEPQMDNIQEEDIELDVEVLELESYEEALDAVQFTQPDQENILSFGNQISINYMLDFGTQNSPTLVENEGLKNPTSYELKLDSQTDSKVDVMTTFNYLLGLQNIQKNKQKIGENEYVIYRGNRNGKTVCIIWRLSHIDIDYEKEIESIDVEDVDELYVNGDSAFEDSNLIQSKFEELMFKEVYN